MGDISRSCLRLAARVALHNRSCFSIPDGGAITRRTLAPIGIAVNFKTFGTEFLPFRGVHFHSEHSAPRAWFTVSVSFVDVTGSASSSPFRTARADAFTTAIDTLAEIVFCPREIAGPAFRLVLWSV